MKKKIFMSLISIFLISEISLLTCSKKKKDKPEISAPQYMIPEEKEVTYNFRCCCKSPLIPQTPQKRCTDEKMPILEGKTKNYEVQKYLDAEVICEGHCQDADKTNHVDFIKYIDKEENFKCICKSGEKPTVTANFGKGNPTAPDKSYLYHKCLTACKGPLHYIEKS